MIQPEELRSVTDNALHGLTADESLKQRILLKASQTKQSNRDNVFRPVLKLCAVVGVLLLMVVALNSVRPLSPSAPGEMNVFAAGGKDTTTANPFTQIDSDQIAGISIGSTEYPDHAVYAEIISILQSESKETDADISSGSDRMVIRMKNGSEHVFGISEPYLSDEDKAWTCPGLFRLLQNLNQ